MFFRIEKHQPTVKKGADKHRPAVAVHKSPIFVLQHFLARVGSENSDPLPTDHREPRDLAVSIPVLLHQSEWIADVCKSVPDERQPGVGSAKLRKDLSFLGPNGVRGVGYDVNRLRIRIERALGLDRGHKVVLVGVGNLGKALVGYGGFSRRGFEMVGLFDSDADRIGSTVGDLVVRSTEELTVACRELNATIGVISTPGLYLER